MKRFNLKTLSSFLTIAMTANIISFSAQAATPQSTPIGGYITHLYSSILGRTPDTGGFNFWYNVTTTNRVTCSQLPAEFLSSPEFQKRNRTLNNEDYVKTLYSLVFKRTYDVGGLNFWLDNLNDKRVTRNDIVQYFLKSPEFDLQCKSYGLAGAGQFTMRVPVENVNLPPDSGSTCGMQTATTQYYIYDLKDMARYGSFCLHVNNHKFDRYDLRELARLGVKIQISVKNTRFDRYDIKDLASVGYVELIVDSNRFDNYDLKDMQKAGVHGITISDSGDPVITGCILTSTTKYDRYDIVSIARRQAVSVCVDSRKFDRYDLQYMQDAGAHIKVYSSAKIFDRYDLSYLADNGYVSLVVDDKSFDRYDLRYIAEKGVIVEISLKNTTLDKYDILSIAEKGKVKVKVDSTRFDSYDLRQLQNAGIELI